MTDKSYVLRQRVLVTCQDGPSSGGCDIGYGVWRSPLRDE